jgi:hypothetical protein
MADANKMQGERDISPAATRARKAAYAQTLGRLNAWNRPRAKRGPCADPAPAPTIQPQKWTLPPHSEFDEFGFPVWPEDYKRRRAPLTTLNDDPPSDGHQPVTQ